MNNSYTLVSLAIGFLLLQSCGHQPAKPIPSEKHCVRQATLPVKYAKGFSVDYYNGFKVVTVNDVKDSTSPLAQYILLPKGRNAPVDFPGAVLVDTPVTKVVCVSTNQMAEMKRLGLLRYITGITGPQLVYDQDIQREVSNGQIANLGQDELNYEKLLTVHPSFVFTSGSYDGGDKMRTKLEALHIPMVIHLDYREQDPLARAEWIKFVAVFFDCEYEADSIFTQIEHRYLSLQAKAKVVSERPTVFCNLPFKEIWYMPSGENYMARLIADAGGDFLWKNSPATNGLNLNLDYEAVYNKALHAKYWLNPGIATSLNELKKMDSKNTWFDAFKQQRVYNNDLRNTPQGGFDFWESGVVNPDKILADLIFIFHPELLPGHQLYYYRKLK